MAESKKEVSGMDAKAMLKEHGEKGTKIKYKSRMTCKIVKKTKFYKLGQIIHPHPVMAGQLIKEGIAEEVK